MVCRQEAVGFRIDLLGNDNKRINRLAGFSGTSAIIDPDSSSFACNKGILSL
jgi:hypothetical protein